jgi:hypothetical protein
MLTTHRESFDIVFEILKLLVMLTMPPDQKLRNPVAYKSRLAVYKESFVNHDIISIIVNVAAVPLSRVGMDRTHQDIQLLELVLTLFRNLLTIVPVKPNITDEFIFALDKEHVYDLMLHLASQAEAPENARFNHLILEFFFLLLAPHDPQVLANTPEFDLEPVAPVAHLAKEPSLLSSSGFSIPASDSGASSGASSAFQGSSSGANSSFSPSKPPSLQGHISSRGAALAAALESSKSPSKTRPGGAAGGIRHSRFGGYVVSSPTVKANVELATFIPPTTEETQKKKKPIPNAEFASSSKNRQSSLMSIVDLLNPKLKDLKPSRSATATLAASAVPGTPSHQGSSILTKLILKRLARRVLDYAFNDLLAVIKGLVNSHSPLMVDSDLDHFVWAIGFFPAFLTCEFQKQQKEQHHQQRQSSASNQRGASSSSTHPDDFNISAVQAIFEEATFYYLLEQLERYETEKNAAKVAIHFLALKHLIFTLFGLFECGLEDHMRISESIIMKLIYNPELLVDRLPRLVRTFSKMKKGQAFILPHLIECVHLFLSVLERISEHGIKKLVQLKKRSKTTGSSKLVGEDEERKASKAIREADAAFIDDDDDDGDNDKQKDGEYNPEANGDDDPDDDYSRKAKQLKELLQSLQDDDDDEDAAQNEKYFDVHDYIAFYSKQSIVVAIMELLRLYETNSDQTNEAVLGMLKRIESLGGLPMLFQVSHLRIFASMLTEAPKTKLSEAALALKRFGRKLAGKFLDHFMDDPVTFGLTTLWPKKLSYAKDLTDGLYLTYNSLYDGTLEEYEERRYSRLRDEDYEPEPAAHTANPSRMGTSYNQRARPYMGEGLQGNVDFDLGDLLAQPTTTSHKSSSSNHASKSKAERLEAKWKELKANQREWSETEQNQLKSLYTSYRDLGEADLVPLIVSMLDIEPAVSDTDVYLQLEKLLDEESFGQLIRPKLDLPDEKGAESARDSYVAPKKRKKVSKPKAASMEEDEVVLAEESDPAASEAVVEASASSDSDSDDSVGFADQPGRGKTAKQIREDMMKRRQELQALEEKRRAELADLAEKRREERAEQRKVNEAAAQEAKEKRIHERAEQREARLAQKERERLAAQEAKELARQEKKAAKEREKLEKRQASGKASRASIKRTAVRKPAQDPVEGEEEATTDQEEGEEPNTVAKSRPKRSAAGRKRTSTFDDYLDTLDLSDEEDGSERPSNQKVQENASSSQMDVDVVPEPSGDKEPTAKSSSIAKGKRRRPTDDDDEDFAAQNDEEAPDNDDQSEDDADLYEGEFKPASKKRSKAPAKSKKAAGTPAKKKAKLSTSASQPDSAPLESSLFTTEEAADEDGRLSRTTTTISTGATRRKLIRNDNGLSSVDQSINNDDDDDIIL